MPLSDIQLLVTRTRVPQLPLDWMARPRLSGKLVEAWRHKLVLISAPAGYGKTTLVIETLHGFKQPAGWVSLEAGDNDPGSFWTYFILALQKVRPSFGQPILNALQSHQQPPTTWVLTALINSISENQEDFTLVLDDYHNIESQAINEAVSYLVDHLPVQVHLIILSRSDPPLPLARWRVKGELAEIRAADLGFTLEEAAQFFKNVTGLCLTGPDLATLENRTEGWIAGLKMAALSLHGRKDISAYVRDFSGSNRYVLDYLAEEVLQQQPSDLKLFLLETSILERLSSPLCDAVTGRSDSQSWLARAEEANLFISPLDDERRWYRYHQLFATILSNQLAKSGPEKVQLLHQRASFWYEKQGLTREAFNHALAGGDTDRAAVLVENAAPDMLGHHQAVALLEYASCLPDALVLASPWLCIFFAWASLMANRPDMLSTMVSRVSAALAESPSAFSARSSANMQRVKGHLLSIQSFIAQSQGDTPGSIRLAEEADRILPGNELDDLLARAVNSLNLVSCHQTTGDISKSIPYLESLAEAGRKINYHYAVLAAMGSLAEIEIQLARSDRADTFCREAIEYGSHWGGACPLSSTAYAYIFLGQLNYAQHDLACALENLTKGIELGEASFNWEPVLKGYLYLAEVSAAQGNQEEAMEYLQRAAKVGPWVFVPPEVAQIPARKARLFLRGGNIAPALDWARQQEASLPLAKIPGYLQEYAYLTLIRTRLAAGEYRGLPDYLGEFVSNAERQQRISMVIEALLLKAQALDRLGQLPAAREALKRALELAEPSGYLQVFIDEGAPITGLLGTMTSVDQQFAYATKILGMMAPLAADQSGTPARTIIPGAVETLSEREIEVLRLITEGKSNKEIASALFLAVGTVKKHTNNLFGKLGVDSRTRAIARARELGIF
jgi:LuxR family transcriptional regulator, maltose regulon positive regulatory protein